MLGRHRHRNLAARLDRLESAISRLEQEAVSARLAAETAAARTRPSEDHASRVIAEIERLRQILRVISDREPGMRERLAQVRQTPEYERAFTDPEPLVSVVIPTYDRGTLLVNRAIPSVTRQTYPNWEIVVVGDTAPEETGRMIDELNDPRVRYRNLSIRGPYPENPRDLWHVAGIPARNAAVAMARGSWIAPLDDDDAFDPEHIAVLLDRVRTQRAEVGYGLMHCLMNDGSSFDLGRFPPEYGHFGWQSAVFHAGLRFFEMELADALFSSPGDWALCRRMVRAGVRFTMVDRIVVDHHESRIDPWKEPSEG
jgi:hypothetical protein